MHALVVSAHVHACALHGHAGLQGCSARLHGAAWGGARTACSPRARERTRSFAAGRMTSLVQPHAAGLKLPRPVPVQANSEGALAQLRELGVNLTRITQLGGHSVARTHSPVRWPQWGWCGGRRAVRAAPAPAPPHGPMPRACAAGGRQRGLVHHEQHLQAHEGAVGAEAAAAAHHGGHHGGMNDGVRRQPAVCSRVQARAACSPACPRVRHHCCAPHGRSSRTSSWPTAGSRACGSSAPPARTARRCCPRRQSSWPREASRRAGRCSRCVRRMQGAAIAWELRLLGLCIAIGWGAIASVRWHPALSSAAACAAAAAPSGAQPHGRDAAHHQRAVGHRRVPGHCAARGRAARGHGPSPDTPHGCAGRRAAGRTKPGGGHHGALAASTCCVTRRVHAACSCCRAWCGSTRVPAPCSTLTAHAPVHARARGAQASSTPTTPRQRPSSWRQRSSGAWCVAAACGPVQRLGCSSAAPCAAAKGSEGWALLRPGPHAPCAGRPAPAALQGAILLNTSGKRFVDELSTRDRVSDAIMRLVVWWPLPPWWRVWAAHCGAQVAFAGPQGGACPGPQPRPAAHAPQAPVGHATQPVTRPCAPPPPRRQEGKWAWLLVPSSAAVEFGQEAIDFYHRRNLMVKVGGLAGCARWPSGHCTTCLMACRARTSRVHTAIEHPTPPCPRAQHAPRAPTCPRAPRARARAARRRWTASPCWRRC